MLKKWKFQAFQLYLFVQLFVSVHNCAKISLPCHFLESINITNGLEQLNGSYSFDGQMFPSGTYGYTDKIYLHDHSNETVKEHLRGCICGGETLKPCISFCCPENYIKKEGSENCEIYEHEPIINSSNTEKYDQINVAKDYKIIHGRKCDSFAINESGDEWKFLNVS